MAKDIGTSNLIDVWASAGPVSEPDISKKNEGWQLGEQPPHEFMNWLQNTFGEKLNHILQNGVAEWNNETQYTAGSAVQHNGSVWVSQTTNTNSTPSDANAAWNRVIEKPDLDAAIGGLGTMSTQNANNVSITGGSITGITDLAVADGGTGRSSLTANNVVLGAGTSAVNFVAPSNLGNVLTSDGTTWISSPGMPSGSIIYVAQNTAPTGYLKANGANVSRSTYANLFAAIGTTYGAGDGSTTFGLPDLRGEFIRGWDDGRGVDSGRAFGTAQADQLQGHWHMVRQGSQGIPPDPDHFTRQSTARTEGGWTFLVSLRAAELLSDGVNGTPRVGSETRARNIALLACIKF